MKIIKKHIISFLTFNVFFCFLVNAQKQSVNDLMWEMYGSFHNNTQEAYYLLDSIDTLNDKKNINYIIYYKLKGLVDENDNNYIKAYQSYNKGLEYAISKNKLIYAGDFNLYLGDLLYGVNAFDKAAIYYKKAEEIFIQKKDTTSLLDLHQGEAYNHFYQEEYHKSLSKLLGDYADFEKCENPMLILNANFMIHSNYLKLDDKKNADIYFNNYKKFKHHFDKYDDSFYPENSYQYNLELIHISLINYFTQKKEIDSAQYYINKLDHKNMTYDILISADYYELLTNFYKLKDNKKLYYTYKDSLYNAMEIMSKNNIIENVNLNEKITAFKQLLAKEDKKSNWIYLITATLLFFIIIAFYYLKKTKQISKQKEIKEKKIITLSNQVTNQNKINLKIKESEHFINEVKTELKSITRMNNSGDRKMKTQDLFIKIHHKSNSEEFEGSYDQLYLFSPSFFNEMKNKFPKLNESELIVCFYININIKNSEIASMLKKSIRSIESTRYRIRKKMEIINKDTTIKEAICTSTTN